MSEQTPILEADLESVNTEPKLEKNPYCPEALFALYPELLEDKEVVVKDAKLFALDFAGYSTIMADPELVVPGTELFGQFKENISSIINTKYPNFTLLKGAGDELLYITENTDLITSLCLSLEIQITLHELLQQDEYRDIKVVLERYKNGSVFANTSLIDTNLVDTANEKTKDNNMYLKLITLADNRQDILTVGKGLSVKDTKSAFGFPISMIPEEYGSPETFVERIQRFGFSAEIGDTAIQLNLPKTLDKNTLQNILAFAEDAEVNSNQNESSTTIKAATNMRPMVENIESVMGPPPKNSGEAAFVALHGINEFREALTRHLLSRNPEDIKGLTDIESEYIAKCVGETAGFFAQELSKKLIVAQPGSEGPTWHTKETEMSGSDELKLIAVHNVYDHNANAQMSKENFARLLEMSQICNEESIWDDLKTILKLVMVEGVEDIDISEIINSVKSKFHVQTGLASAGKDNINWLIPKPTEQYTGGDDINGSLLSASARFWSYIAKGRAAAHLEDLKAIQSPDETINVELAALNKAIDAGKNSCIILQKSMADQLGIDITKHAVVKTKLKGFGEKEFELVVIETAENTP